MNKEKSKILVSPNGAEPTLTPAELAALEKQERSQACAEEINAVLAKFGCRFSPVVILTEGRFEVQVNIVAV